MKYLAASFAAAFLLLPFTANAATIYIQDTFVRANQSGWGTASGGGAWTAKSQGTGWSSAISSNTGQQTGNNNGDGGNWHSLSQQNGIDIQVSFTTSASFNSGSFPENYLVCVRYDTTTTRCANAYGVDLSGTGTSAIVDHGTNKATGSFTFAASTAYNLEITIDSNNWMDVYVWAASGSKPGSPTISWHNGGTPYTPTASGSSFVTWFLPNQGGNTTLTTTSVLVQQLSTGASFIPWQFFEF